MIINTHSHIYDEAFDTDREEVFRRAMEAGVGMLLLPNCDEKSVKPMMEFYERHPKEVRIMMGLHPEEVYKDKEDKKDYKEKLGIIEDEVSRLTARNDSSVSVGVHNPLVGIGEIGLDFYWDDTFKKEQIEVLSEQLHWAKELGLPVSLHTRNAFHEMFKVLDHEQDGRLAGVMHCFNGTFDEARTALSYGFHLGLGGVITYKSCGVKDFLAEIPMEKIVLETDDPYLPPVPYRGQRNEPAYIVKTAEKVAEIYGVTTEEICKITTENAIKLFKLEVRS
ncbi:MAG: TatD family hydrolase [Bacteroidales bacterium]|nr:TatD family hydrolase [Bacteroidales bacterium]